MITHILPFGLLNQVLKKQERARNQSPSALPRCDLHVCGDLEKRWSHGCEVDRLSSPPSSSPDTIPSASCVWLLEVIAG